MKSRSSHPCSAIKGSFHVWFCYRYCFKLQWNFSKVLLDQGLPDREGQRVQHLLFHGGLVNVHSSRVSSAIIHRDLNVNEQSGLHCLTQGCPINEMWFAGYDTCIQKSSCQFVLALRLNWILQLHIFIFPSYIHFLSQIYSLDSWGVYAALKLDIENTSF